MFQVMLMLMFQVMLVMMCQVSACVHVCVDVMLPCSIVLKPKP